MADWITVATTDEIPLERVKVVTVGDKRIAVCHAQCDAGPEFYAIDDLCTHDGGPLDQGELFGCEIECPRHGAHFDVRTGAAVTLPAVYPVKTYPVRVEGDQVQIQTE